MLINKTSQVLKLNFNVGVINLHLKFENIRLIIFKYCCILYCSVILNTFNHSKVLKFYNKRKSCQKFNFVMMVFFKNRYLHFSFL